ncbi:MAG: NnrS family protein [Deltaproteobacteria bacterium]|nr:NnrS family protein [Deltaproteobacteria bacterium]
MAPYQWGFPLGFLAGIGGIGVWVLFWTNLFPLYPGVLHAEGMIGGFLVIVATGFLMTALPRFSGTRPASRRESGFLIATSVALLSSLLFAWRLPFHTTLWLHITCWFSFALSRLRTATVAPPPPFFLVGVGWAIAWCSTTVWLLADLLTWQWPALSPLSPLLLRGARQGLLYGFPIALMLGIGARIVPMIQGRETPPPTAPSGGERPVIRPQPRFIGYAAVLLCGLMAKTWGQEQLGHLLLALLVTTRLVSDWRVTETPPVRGTLSRTLWCAAWGFLIGLWGPVIAPRYAIHTTHIFFIGGVTLLIFGVATRVILAHGDYGLRLEQRSWAIRLLLIAFLLALGTRITAPFITNYFSHLAYAAIFWLLGVAAWSWTFAPKLFRWKARPPR